MCFGMQQKNRKETKHFKSKKRLHFKFSNSDFLNNNIYLLLASVLLLSVSLITESPANKRSAERNYSKKIERYIHKAADNFSLFIADRSLIQNLIKGKAKDKILTNPDFSQQYLFIYKTTEGFTQLSFWSTQNILPDQKIINAKEQQSIVKLSNGFYFVQKKIMADLIIISLLPIKWEYSIPGKYLKNEFLIDPEEGKLFNISSENNYTVIKNHNSNFLFSIEMQARDNPANNTLTLLLRMLSIIPLLLFIHFASVSVFLKQGIFKAAAVLCSALLFLRLISYYFNFPVNLRQFELFDPAIYGSGIVFRSLGDLLINTVLFLWVINFAGKRLNIKSLHIALDIWKKWLFFSTGIVLISLETYATGHLIRSLVADSQISFDVINFFSLDIFSLAGILVLCFITLGYYYSIRIIYSFLKDIIPHFTSAFFLSVAIAGLLMLSFRIGKLSGGFELYELLWLLIFLFFLRNDFSGYFSGSSLISRIVLRLLFFSISAATVIINENNRKEMQNMEHYAEMLSEKTNPISGVLVNTMLTEFRPDLLADKFLLLTHENEAGIYRDSLINNNLKGFSDKYDTEVLVFDSLEAPIYNSNPISYNSLNSILTTQSKLTTVPGLFYFDEGYDRFNYIARRVIIDYKQSLLGYVFIIIRPKNLEGAMLYPELFDRGTQNSIENSSEYAYAIYNKGKLVNSHNDYPFSTVYPGKIFEGKIYLPVQKDNYKELWYNAGSEKYVVIVKEDKSGIELITLISYIFFSFLILSALAWVISLFIRSGAKILKFKSNIQLNIRQQVHTTIIFFSAISFIIIGITAILFFISRYEKNNRESLSRTIRIMANDLRSSLTVKSVQDAVFHDTQDVLISEPQKIINRLSLVHGHDVNLYSISGDLKASSLPLPYIKGIVSTKMNPFAYYRMHEGKDIQFFQNEHIGKLDFVSDYLPVTDSTGKEIAYLNIPYFASQHKLKEEISNFLVTIINLNAFIFLIAGLASIIITNRITRSFSVISDKMKKINLGKRNDPIIWERNDEIGTLVKEYNRMLAKLDESAAALIRTERESAWQEMAKQVAHEIKNPLTPMKLSMQFLQRSIDNDAPNIKELSTKVSATLVEQIDHLSNIAGEFSRFANIENASPEIFNLNDALRSVKQLYEGDNKLLFEWRLLSDPVMINADKTHINRILTNLILNGIQAVKADTIPHILIQEKLQQKIVEISINDNGSGIPEEMQSKIFTPNFTTKSSGTGLGLAMCLRMAHRAGGDMRYETSSGGSTFFVTLPLTKK